MSKPHPPLCDWSSLPAAARKLREQHENGDRVCQVIYIFDPVRAAGGVIGEADPERRAQAFRAGEVAVILVKSTPTSRGILVRVLAMVSVPDTGMWGFYYATVCGGGMDLLAAALDGCPLPAVGLTLGDHCDSAGDPTLDALARHGLAVLKR